MRIRNFKVDPPSGTALAEFDLELGPDLTLRKLVLRRNSMSEVRCSPARLPNGHGRSADLAPHLSSKILVLALAAYAEIKKGPVPDAIQHA